MVIIFQALDYTKTESVWKLPKALFHFLELEERSGKIRLPPEASVIVALSGGQKAEPPPLHCHDTTGFRRQGHCCEWMGAAL